METPQTLFLKIWGKMRGKENKKEKKVKEKNKPNKKGSHLPCIFFFLFPSYLPKTKYSKREKK